jgi:hypothetical protein
MTQLFRKLLTLLFQSLRFICLPVRLYAELTLVLLDFLPRASSELGHYLGSPLHTLYERRYFKRKIIIIIG